MYISNLSHFLDEKGEIAKEMHKEGREHASFLALIVDTATKSYPTLIDSTEIRCQKKKCTGNIEIGFDIENEIIEWWCNNCSEGGKISGWQGTKWDNRK